MAIRILLFRIQLLDQILDGDIFSGMRYHRAIVACRAFPPSVYKIIGKEFLPVNVI